MSPSSCLREERLDCKAVSYGVTNGGNVRPRRRRVASGQDIGRYFCVSRSLSDSLNYRARYDGAAVLGWC